VSKKRKLKAPKPLPFPTVTCIICKVEVIATEAGQTDHLATRTHVRNAIDAAIQKLTGWACPGPLFPMQRPISFLE
jgi:hypothetical protein